MPSIPGPIRRLGRPGRRVMRRAILGNHAILDRQQLQDLWDWVNGLQETVNNLVNENGRLQNLMTQYASDNGEHVDLVVDQLWRRLEAADARLASEVQRFSQRADRQLEDLSNLAARLANENAAILRLIGHAEYIQEDSAVADSLPIAHMTLFSEVERGSTAVLEAKLAIYVPMFDDADGPVIDLGCGQGSFLALMTDRGNTAYGVDLDEDAVRLAKERGLDARLEDVFEHLAGLEPNSLGGALSSQVVEHLPPETILPLYEALYRVLKPGARVVIETPNPATFATHVQSFWRDPTHIRPVPQPALDFCARSAGFVAEKTVYASKSPEHLDAISLEPQDPLLADLVSRFNSNVEKLDELLYGYQDYAFVVRKP